RHHKPQRRAEAIAVEKIVRAYSDVEDVPRCEARRVVVVIFRPCFRDHHTRRSVVRDGAFRIGKPIRNRGPGLSAEEADRGLLGSRQRKRIFQAAYRTRHHAAIVAPGPRAPRTMLPVLVAELRGLLERLVVVDPEYRAPQPHVAVKHQAAGLRREVARPRMSHGGGPLESAKIRRTDARGDSVYLRFVPGNREGNWCIEEDSKIVRIVGIFPKIIRAGHKPSPDRMLQTRVVLIPSPRM